MLALLIAASLSAFIALAADLTGFSGVWHFLNVQAIVCPGAPGYTNISISKPAVNLHRPHVLTIFRTTNDAVTIAFTVTDSAGKVVASQPSGLTLQAVPSGSRRLSGTASEAIHDQDAETKDAADESNEDEKEREIDDVDDELEELEVVNASDDTASGPRRLSARRRSYSGSYSSSSSYSYSRSRSSYSSYSSSYSSPRRRYSSYSSSYSSPRRRGPSYSSYSGSSYSNPRRRGASYSSSSTYSYPRRRGFTQPTGTRRRSVGYDSMAYTNPYSRMSGRYGYSSSGYATSQYGGRLPMTTSYGYTGANAYKSNSGMKIAMAAGGGLLAGYAVSSMMHNMHNPYGYGYTDMSNPFGYSRAEMLSMQCTAGSWSGLCSSCITAYSANTCNVEFTPKIDATRDDLMGTGFIPADYTWPLSVKVTAVSSTAFNPSIICPPSLSDTTWKAPAMKQLFLTMTTVEELDHQAQGDTGSSGTEWWVFLLGTLFPCCCICGCIAACAKMNNSKKHQWDGSYSDSEMEMHYGGHPGFVQPPPFYPAGGNPYWNPPGPGGIASMGSPPGSDHSFRGEDGGFMATAAPVGKTWNDYCQPHQVFTSEHSRSISQPWGECVAWAKAYEHNNPGWENDPRMRGGPCAHVIQAMCENSPDHMSGAIVQAAEMLEEECEEAIRQGRPLPVINQRV